MAESGAQEALERWMEQMLTSGAVVDGALWPDLDPQEVHRRCAVMDRCFPEVAPARALLTDGEDAALARLREDAGHQRRRDVVSIYQDFVWTAVMSSVDGAFTSDGQNYRARSQAWGEFEEACRRVLAARQEPAELGDVLGPDLGDRGRLYASTLHRMIKSDEQAVLAPGAWQASSEGGSQRELVWLAMSWATPPQILEMLARHPSPNVRKAVLCNPMSPVTLLEDALTVLPYPTEIWAQIDEDEHAVAVLSGPDMLPEDLQEGVETGLSWRRILIENLMLPSHVVLAVASALSTFLEAPTEAAALLHPSCPSHILGKVALDSVREYPDRNTVGIDWPVACVAANPQSPPDSLARLAALPRTESIDVLEIMDVTVEDSLAGVAVNPSTTAHTRAVLASVDSDAVALALRATAEGF